MTTAELEMFLHRSFPQVRDDFEITDLAPSRIEVALRASDKHLRPGGTVSGPAMFSLVDASAYLCILSMLGPVTLAVTTNCSIDFMRKPAPGRLLCRMELLKLGRVLAVCEGRVVSQSAPSTPVARAALTYSIPPKER